ncbi:MAG TPA: MarR family transcriptional regulator [Opitutus sp.]|nr:MarR family transcriptional regulator [Opitutus sp.]
MNNGKVPATSIRSSLMSRTTSTLQPADNGAATMSAVVASAFERECIAFFADVVQVFGVPRSVGQVYGLLFASPQPLSFTDIAERLDISRGSASQGLQALRGLGAVRSVSSDGDRRERFEPELGLRKLVSGVLKEQVETVVAEGGARIRKLREHASAAPDAAGRNFSEERVKQIEKWRSQMRLLLPLMKTILGPARA